MFSELVFINIAIAGRGEKSTLTQIGVSCYDLGTRDISRVWHKYIFEGGFNVIDGLSRAEVASDLMEARAATTYGVPLIEALAEMQKVLLYNKHSIIGSNDKANKIMLCSFDAVTIYQNLTVLSGKLL